jgi:uncharacterized membrane protein
MPTWVQWYLRPAGEYTAFTAFPWVGFVFGGAACGALIASARGPASDRRLHVAFSVTGVALIALGLLTAAQPTIYAASSFWTSSPTWFAIRCGVMMLALSGLYAAERAFGSQTVSERAASWPEPLTMLGRHSLLVYWIHVELVYGYASWLWRGRLPLWTALSGCAALSALMYGAAVLKGVESRRRVRLQPGREEVA